MKAEWRTDGRRFGAGKQLLFAVIVVGSLLLVAEGSIGIWVTMRPNGKGNAVVSIARVRHLGRPWIILASPHERHLSLNQYISLNVMVSLCRG